LRASGQLIEDADLLIAARALVYDMTLVTHNTAHFARISGLQIDDWLMP
jgi:tRNA(fMet)-specific endonuclease VapC